VDNDDDDMEVGDGNSSASVGIRVALSLYKVQANIYLLDFQRVEGNAFGFMKLCALIITELKNLSAASRAQSLAQMAAANQPNMGSANPQAALSQLSQQEQQHRQNFPPQPPSGSEQMDTA
jgi:hypothetical protein